MKVKAMTTQKITLLTLTLSFSFCFSQIEEIKKNTRRFSKRQLTWFKRNENTKWFDYSLDRKQIIQHIEERIK